MKKFFEIDLEDGGKISIKYSKITSVVVIKHKVFKDKIYPSKIQNLFRTKKVRPYYVKTGFMAPIVKITADGRVYSVCTKSYHRALELYDDILDNIT